MVVTDEGMTFEEFGGGLFALMQTETRTSLACPFGNGLATFIGRNNDNYAGKFCARGCSPYCYWEMIAENRRRYDKALVKLAQTTLEGFRRLRRGYGSIP